MININLEKNMVIEISIIGLGLIGGSLAKSFHLKIPTCKITAIDSNTSTLHQALQDGMIQKGTDQYAEGVKDADIVFICTPVSDILKTLSLIAPYVKEGCIVTDTGSIKSTIIKKNQQILPDRTFFIGGHPMAGSEKTGYHNSSAHMLENAYYIFTPDETIPSEQMIFLSEVVKQAGCIPLILSSELHDHITGLISHLPHIIAAGLVNLVHQDINITDTIQRLAAGGFKDITRIASSSPFMWTDICLYNSEELHNIIQIFLNILKTFDQWMIQEDRKAIFQFFESARMSRNNIPSKKQTFIYNDYDIYIDVQDKPGIIGEIAMLLGTYNINIKNIGIINSREEEPGVLRISLPDSSSQMKSMSILKDKGYLAFQK